MLGEYRIRLGMDQMVTDLQVAQSDVAPETSGTESGGEEAFLVD